MAAKKKQVNEVFETMKQETRERMAQQGLFDDHPTSNPLNGIVDDLTPDTAAEGPAEVPEPVEASEPAAKARPKAEAPAMPAEPVIEARPDTEEARLTTEMEQMQMHARAGSEQALIAELTEILKVPKPRDALMTFSMYTVGQFTRRYFILDVDGAAYRRAWEVFKERTQSTDATRFMDLIFHILNTDMPRLHRNVDWVPLN